MLMRKSAATGNNTNRRARCKETFYVNLLLNDFHMHLTQFRLTS